MLDQPKPGAGQPCPSACDAVAQVPADLGRDDLNGLLILRHVCLDDVWGLLASCSVRCLEPGDVLLAAGQPNDTLYMVLEGRLRVHLHAESEPVAFIEAGQTVGEMSVIDGSPASAHVMAASTSRLLAVDEETFWRMIAASHNFASNLLVLLARRMRANNSSLSASAEIRGELERQATVDGLTGLFNRRFLESKLPRLVHRFGRSGESLSLLLIDIDHFKRFNDEHGHLSGDRVLAAVAATLQQGVRPTDVAVRYGGEEMLVVLPDTALQGALIAAERLRASVEALTLQGADGRPLPRVTISVGAAALEAQEAPQSLVDRADAALYRAKRAGRNRVER